MEKEVQNLLSRFEGKLFIEVYKNDNTYEPVMNGYIEKEEFLRTIKDCEIEGVKEENIYIKTDSKSYIYVIDGFLTEIIEKKEGIFK